MEVTYLLNRLKIKNRVLVLRSHCLHYYESLDVLLSNNVFTNLTPQLPVGGATTRCF